MILDNDYQIRRKTPDFSYGEEAALSFQIVKISL